MAEPERAGVPRETAHGDGTAAQEGVRALIRAEIARHDPTDYARGPLALIAETSVRASLRDGAPVVSVVDAQGHPRTRMADGQQVEFTLSDLVEELRERHPALFRPAARRPAPAFDPPPPLPSVPSGDDLARQVAPHRDAPRQDAPRQDPPREDPPREDPPREIPRPDDRPHAGLPRAVPLRSDQPRPDVTPDPAPTPAPVSEPRRQDRPSRIRVSHRRIARFPVRMVTRFVERVRDAEPVPVSGPDTQPERRSETLDRAKTLLADMRDGAPRRWTLIAAALLLAALLGVGALQIRERFMGASDADETIAMGEAPRSEPAATGAVAEVSGPATLRGAAEAIDTATLRMQGRIVRLFGVEWAKGGGKSEDLTTYLNGREVTCEPAGGADVYRCQVGGQDLSKVVLFNGGGRTTAQATGDLKAAEDNARSGKVGVWSE